MLAAMKIAFIGLGRMGAGMARNLLRAGHTVAVYNRSREKAEALAADGARVANSPADAASGAEAVMTMVADDQALDQIVFGSDGIASAMKADCIHISHSTISTAMARKLTAEHAQRKQGYLSVPVFGRPEAAESKNLVVVAAGPSELVERCRPLFDAIGRQTFVIGSEPWQANVAKVCGNFMVIGIIEALGEAYATLRKAGVAPEMFLEIMNALLGSQVITGYGRIIAAGKLRAGRICLEAGFERCAPGACGLRGMRLANAAGQPGARSSALRARARSGRDGLVKRGASDCAQRRTEVEIVKKLESGAGILPAVLRRVQSGKTAGKMPAPPFGSEIMRRLWGHDMSCPYNISTNRRITHVPSGFRAHAKIRGIQGAIQASLQTGTQQGRRHRRSSAHGGRTHSAERGKSSLGRPAFQNHRRGSGKRSHDFHGLGRGFHDGRGPRRISSSSRKTCSIGPTSMPTKTAESMSVRW